MAPILLLIKVKALAKKVYVWPTKHLHRTSTRKSDPQTSSSTASSEPPSSSDNQLEREDKLDEESSSMRTFQQLEHLARGSIECKTERPERPTLCMLQWSPVKLDPNEKSLIGPKYMERVVKGQRGPLERRGETK